MKTKETNAPKYREEIFKLCLKMKEEDLRYLLCYAAGLNQQMLTDPKSA